MHYKQNVLKAINDTHTPFNIGIEREGLRVDENGALALSEHPAVFGEKLKNYHIKTDFCESQPELVTSVCTSTNEMYEQLAGLTEKLKSEIIKNGEYFWSQSMPCILPDEQLIKTAIHPGDFAKPLRDYLELVRRKYTAKHQTLCGVHFNFSLTDEFWNNLKALENSDKTLIEFKNEMYMKLLRNYFKHSWFSLLLTGCSPAVHNSFEHNFHDKALNERDFYISDTALCLHFSRIGYHNPNLLEVDYSSLNSLCDSLVKGVKDKILIDQGELFAPIKAKAKDNVNLVDSFKNDGILYLEIRNLDLNMFDKYGFAKDDMDFLMLFLLYMLIIPEKHYENWVNISHENNLLVAENGLDYSIEIKSDNENISLKDKLNEIVNDLSDLNSHINVCDATVFQKISERLLNPSKSYSAQAYSEFIYNGFINTNMKYIKSFK